MTLPPGQRAAEGSALRHALHHRSAGTAIVIEIGGALTETITLSQGDLARLPRQERKADFPLSRDGRPPTCCGREPHSSVFHTRSNR